MQQRSILTNNERINNTKGTIRLREMMLTLCSILYYIILRAAEESPPTKTLHSDEGHPLH